MPTNQEQWIAFWFVTGVLGVFVWYGAGSLKDWIVEKALLSRIGGGRASVYDNFTRPPTLESEPKEDEEEVEHPLDQTERILGPYETALQDTMRRFESAEASMLQMNAEMERMRRQQLQYATRQSIMVPLNFSGTITRRMNAQEERPRVATNPNTCDHMWQDIATSAGRSFRICGLCGTTEDAGLITMPPAPACSRHVWGKPTMTLNAQREIIRQFLCEKCGRTKTERVKQMTIEEAKAKRVRSIFLED